MVTSATSPESVRDATDTVLTVRHATDPESVRGLTTAQLRARYLVEGLFAPDRITLVYSLDDRMVAGGAVPATRTLSLEPAGPINGDHFLANREAGILHVGGGPAVITVDGERHELGARDLLYVGRGSRSVQLGSADPAQPGRLYLVSTVAHRSCPTRRISLADVEPVAVGAAETSNRRRIHKYVNPGQVESCSLMMGVTILEPGDTWNTMPPHTHDRRSEIYFYFDLAPDGRVFHFMGEPDETRHLVVATEQAVISPCWSIHSGSGTTAYSFCWAMAGENLVYNDMDAIDIGDLR